MWDNGAQKWQTILLYAAKVLPLKHGDKVLITLF